MTYLSERGRIIPPNLDDRNWQEIVDELRTLIPHYAPQWTDHNPSDLGITLIEMFAMLVEGLIFRLNRIPDKHYIAFLKLLGITRYPPTPAMCYLTFTAPGGTTVPAGTQAQTLATELEPGVIFETDTRATILPINLKYAVVVGPYTSAQAAVTYTDRSELLVGPPTGRVVLNLAKDQTVQICLGFDGASTQEVALRLQLFRVLLGGQASVTVVCSTGSLDPHKWPSTPPTDADGTDGLQHDGEVRASPPAGWTPQRPSPGDGQPGWAAVTASGEGVPLTQPAHWLGLRIANTTPGPISVGIDRLLFNYAPAHNALTIRAPELLGTGNNQPFQEFTLAHAPLYESNVAGGATVIEVGTGVPPVWEQWPVVDDLPAGPQHVCRIDPITGSVLFGNHDDKTGEGHGAPPPEGAQVRARTYRYVAGGTSGNVAPNQITTLGTRLDGARPAGVSAVTNNGPAFDGSDEEPIDETLRRAPDVLKTRDRAVTAEDYENLARAAATDVVTVRCLGPRLTDKGTPWAFAGMTRAPGSVYVIVMPDKGPDDGRPEPSPNLLNEVKDYLDRRRDLTAALSVVGPRYLPVSVAATLRVWREATGVDRKQLEADTRQRINDYLHPTRGGPRGAGWEPGQPVFASDVFRAIAPPENVGYIETLQLSADIPAYGFPPLKPDGTKDNWKIDEERPFKLADKQASVRVTDYETVCAGANHDVRALQAD